MRSQAGMQLDTAYGELDPIDPHSYPTFELARARSRPPLTHRTCLQMVGVPTCHEHHLSLTKKAAVLYEGEELVRTIRSSGW